MKPELSILPERPAIELDPKRTFDARQRARIFQNAKGRCQLCGIKIRGRWIAGHIKAHSMGGKTEVKNGRVECPDCGGETHKEDTHSAAQAERMAGRKGQYARRKRRDKPLLQARGFDKRYRKKMNGEVEKRND